MCNACEDKPVLTLISGQGLCKKHFLEYFEKKVRKTIRVHNLVDKEDVIVVAVSGGKDSLTVLDLLQSIFSKNQSITIKALLVDEGIKDYRDQSVEYAKKFCKERNVELTIASYKGEFGFELDNVVEGRNPCSVCGVLRRNVLKRYAKKMGATKLATGHNMDDEAQSILMNQFRRNVETSARLGPITGVVDHEEFVRRIKPLYFVTEKEVMTYAFIKGIVEEFNECPYNKVSYRHKVRGILNQFEEEFPGTKNSIVKSFMEILPMLKEKYKGKAAINQCVKCSEPTSKDLCQKCIVLEEIGSS